MVRSVIKKAPYGHLTRRIMMHFFKKKTALINETLLLLLCTIPTASHATSIESILRAGASYLTGTVAKAAGVLAIISVGYLTLFTQKLPKEYLMMILIGSGFIFGGAELYSRWVR